MNPSMNHTVGLLIEGSTRPLLYDDLQPTLLCNPGRELRFRQITRPVLLLGRNQHASGCPDKYLDVCHRIEERTGPKSVTSISKHFGRDARAFLGIYNNPLKYLGFVPFSDRELKDMAFSLKFLIVPDLVVALELDGKIVGASFCLPDYNPRIRAIKGKLFPFGFIRLLRKKEKIKKLRILSTNVLPEYQMLGLGLVLVNALVPRVLAWGIQEVEFSWVLESNQYSRGSLERGGAILNKTFRVYDKAIG